MESVSIPQAVGTVTSLPLFSPPFGQGLEMCGPHRRFAPLLPRTLRRIPQAVSTVATGVCKYAELHSRHCKVSIPQAVSTVTSSPLFSLPFGQGLEMCGPHRRFTPLLPRTLRRIPQAVGTVTSLPLFSPPFSQGLEMCGPHRRFAPLLPRTLRRIPQAVSTVATPAMQRN